MAQDTNVMSRQHFEFTLCKTSLLNLFRLSKHKTKRLLKIRKETIAMIRIRPGCNHQVTYPLKKLNLWHDAIDRNYLR